MTKDDGGPAFPVGPFDGTGYVGMTLRDYFAANAMQSIWNSEHFRNFEQDNGTHNAETWLAMRAYRIADAMLAERRKQ